MPIRWIKANEPWMEESIKYRVTIEHELRRYVVVVVDADTFAWWFAINITRWTQPQRFRLKNDVHRDVKPQTERNRVWRIFGRIFLDSSMKTFERVVVRRTVKSRELVGTQSPTWIDIRTFTLESSTKNSFWDRFHCCMNQLRHRQPCTCKIRSQTRKKKPQAKLAQKTREKRKKVKNSKFVASKGRTGKMKERRSLEPAAIDDVDGISAVFLQHS